MSDTQHIGVNSKKRASILQAAQLLYEAYRSGMLGDITMPEDQHPESIHESLEQQLTYFTLPMALNYQRDSFSLWKSATRTYEDKETNIVFDITNCTKMSIGEVRSKLVKHKLALQPNKHIDTWYRLCQAFSQNGGTIQNFFESHEYDVKQIKQTIQKDRKKEFPYLSGPKICNYWLYIIDRYTELSLKNKDQIEVAPDTHVVQASVKLGVLHTDEIHLDKHQISNRWRELLSGSGIDPIDMHSPLWFWSKNKFSPSIETLQLMGS